MLYFESCLLAGLPENLGEVIFSCYVKSVHQKSQASLIACSTRDEVQGTNLLTACLDCPFHGCSGLHPWELLKEVMEKGQ